MCKSSGDIITGIRKVNNSGSKYLYKIMCSVFTAIRTSGKIIIYLYSTTYDSLGNSNIIRWSGRSGLVRSTGVSQNGQLLGTTDTALAQAAQLDPVCANGLISVDDKVVTFA